MIKKVSDFEIMLLAEKKNISVREATALAIEHNIIPERYLKNLGTISTQDQAHICRTRLLVCGCGGLGGHIIQLAARLGFGFIRIVDHDRFDLSNLNRQPFCIADSLFFPKVLATKEIIRRINSLVEVEAFESRVMPSHFDDVDIVLDGFDNPKDRISAEEEANRRGIPFIHGAVRGWWGQVTTTMPDDRPKLKKLYAGVKREARKHEEELGTLVPVVSMIASVQIHEAIRIATSKSPLYSGKLFYWDGESGTAMIINL
ncbi:MAG: ThiF family adenylyltransferase [Thermodesulforhabdaceae bacterium]